MLMTQHAERRIQERHISSEQLNWLLCYGQTSHNRGVCLYFFDHDGFAHLLRDIEPDKQALALQGRNIYAVLGESAVITVGYRDKRIKRQKSHKRIRRLTPRQPAGRRIHHNAP